VKKKSTEKAKKVIKKKVVKKIAKKKIAKKVVIKKVVKKPIKKKIVRKKIVVKKPIKKIIEKKTVKKEKPVKAHLKKTVKKVDNIVQETVHKTRVRIIGIGGGGGTIVSEIISRVKRADFVVANTDAKALGFIKHAKKFQFGQSITKGLGTGMNVEIGEAAALEEKDRIEKLFEGQDICIIVSSLGGGAGSGATPIFAKISKNTECLTYGIFTLPFQFEGEKKMEIAKEALNKIRPHLNAFSVIPNERIFKIIDKNTPLKEALSAINERLSKNLQGLIEMIYLPGLINIDFADLKTILSGKGKLAYLNTIEVNEPNKEDAVKRVISSPLYPYTIKGAKGIVYNIVGSKAIQLSEVSRISTIISEEINRSAKIIFGINQSERSSDKIRITLLATGCSMKGIIDKPPRKKTIKKIVIKEAPKVEAEIVKEPIKVDKPVTRKIVKKKPVKKVISKPTVAPKPIVAPKPVEQKPETSQNSGNVEIRRNALQVRKAVEQEENEFIEREKAWETPAILRKKEES